MLRGRLGLESARIPHADRHGLVHLDRGTLAVLNGCLHFSSAGGGALEPGEYSIPHQTVSFILLGPGSSVTHDALRLLARHGTGIAAVGDDGVRMYTAPPLLPDFSSLARRQVTLWADAKRGRLLVARRMYARRLGVVMPHRDITVLRGIEGARVKALYGRLAARYGVPWHGRRYDRADPMAADDANQAINHAASAVEAAAAIAVAATATIPQLGFIHEDSGQSFVLDVADLFRDSVTLPCAFRAIGLAAERPGESLERAVRKFTGATLRKQAVISVMIDAIKQLFDEPPDADSAGRSRKPSSSDRPRSPARSDGEPTGNSDADNNPSDA